MQSKKFPLLTMEPVLLLLLIYLFSSVSSATTTPNSDLNNKFLQCLSFHSPSSFTTNNNFPSYVYTQDSSPSYLSLLQSSIQNLRFNYSNSEDKPIPQFIITPQSESHVQAAVICSRKHGLEIRVRSGGHDYEGLSFMSNVTFVIIDLVNLRSISVNVEDETAWVQAGAILGELYHKIANKSRTLAFPAGVCPTIGVGGHFSGGGMGTMMRKYGLAADNVIDALIVDVHGKILDRANMGEDLFWAIRGGGAASFGVVIAWKIKLVPVPPTVTVFTIRRTLEQDATQLVHRWQHIADMFHEDLFIRVIVTSSKNENGGKTVQALFNSLFLGTIEELLPLMSDSFPELGLEAKDCKEMSWIETILYFDGQPLTREQIDRLPDRNNVRKGYFKAKSDFVTEPISEIGLEGIFDMFFEDNTAIMIFDPYGGMMSEISDSETPFPHRAGNLYNIQYLVKWIEEQDLEETNKHIDWIKRAHKYMTPYVSTHPRGAYLNYRDLDLGRNEYGTGDISTNYLPARVWGKSYFKDNFDRLTRVKSLVDPQNFFKNEQSIPPCIPH